jgi:Trypsin-co-occurring domain 1
MAELVEYPLEDGGVLFVQSVSVDAGQGGLGLASSAEETAKKAKETLESAMANVTPALKSVTSKLKDLSPDNLTVEFGLALTAETGVIVAKGGAEVHFTVTLSWSEEARRRSAKEMAGRDQGGLSGNLVVFLTHGSSWAVRADDGGVGAGRIYRPYLWGGRERRRSRRPSWGTSRCNVRACR